MAQAGGTSWRHKLVDQLGTQAVGAQAGDLLGAQAGGTSGGYKLRVEAAGLGQDTSVTGVLGCWTKMFREC